MHELHSSTSASSRVSGQSDRLQPSSLHAERRMTAVLHVRPATHTENLRHWKSDTHTIRMHYMGYNVTGPLLDPRDHSAETIPQPSLSPGRSHALWRGNAGSLSISDTSGSVVVAVLRPIGATSTSSATVGVIHRTCFRSILPCIGESSPSVDWPLQWAMVSCLQPCASLDAANPIFVRAKVRVRVSSDSPKGFRDTRQKQLHYKAWGTVAFRLPGAKLFFSI